MIHWEVRICLVKPTQALPVRVKSYLTHYAYQVSLMYSSNLVNTKIVKEQGNVAVELDIWFDFLKCPWKDF